MRGESLEPGGCSAWPTSPWTAFTIACPAEPAGAGAPVRVAAFALRSCVAKLVAGVAAVGAVVGAGGAGGLNRLWSWAIRAIATSKLMHHLHRYRGARALAPGLHSRP